MRIPWTYKPSETPKETYVFDQLRQSGHGGQRHQSLRYSDANAELSKNAAMNGSRTRNFTCAAIKILLSLFGDVKKIRRAVI